MLVPFAHVMQLAAFFFSNAVLYVRTTIEVLFKLFKWMNRASTFGTY